MKRGQEIKLEIEDTKRTNCYDENNDLSTYTNKSETKDKHPF